MYLQVFIIVCVVCHSPLPFKGLRVCQLDAGVSNAQVLVPGTEGKHRVGDAEATYEGHVLCVPKGDLKDKGA